MHFTAVNTTTSKSRGVTSIPLSVPHLAGKEWEYVKQCLDDNWVSSAGPFVEKFEQVVAHYVGSRYAVATVNGTSAIHIALLVSGIRAGDEVLVPSLTFIAPVNAIRYCGAWPVFFDVDTYLQMDVEKVREFLQKECTHHVDGTLTNRHSGRPVKGILPVHLLGHAVDMDALLEIARQYGLKIIEDATESLGSKYKSRNVGQLGPISTFSFNGNKVITTGGGGMIVTDNDEWARKAKYLTTQAKDDEKEFIHKEIGFNYRLTNLQAAIGLAQMEQLDTFLARKREIAARYREAFAGFKSLSCIPYAEWADPTFWLNAVRVMPGIPRRNVMEALQQDNIETRPLWHPIHSLPPYRDCVNYKVERVNQLYAEVLTLPSSTGLSADDQEFVISSLLANLNE